MRRLLLIALACLVSLGAEAVAARLCPLPLTELYIGTLIKDKLGRAAAIGARPKLVLLAGSNGLFSHRCEVIEPVLGMPCVNASVAVGVGLDYLLARWQPLLRPGDVLYMPMEPPQYVRSRAKNRVGPESRLMIHGDWRTLLRLAPDRQLAAVLSVDPLTELRNEMAAPPPADRQRELQTAVQQQMNAWGDRIGHTRAEAAGARGDLDRESDTEPDAAEIQDGYGTTLVAAIVRWATRHGIAVIGGLSTGFDDVPLPDASVAAMQDVFLRNGGRFLELPGRSRYPRHDFFDTRYHLYEACQVRYSIVVADALAPMLGRAAAPPPAWAERAECPGIDPGPQAGRTVAASAPAAVN